jgi:hypothetical protein
MHHLSRENGLSEEIRGLLDLRKLSADAVDDVRRFGEIRFSGRHEEKMK